MITDILAGMLLGTTITLLGAYAFMFIAKRKRWIRVEVAPDPSLPRDTATDMVVRQLVDDVDNLSTRIDAIDRLLEPYVGRKKE